MQPRNLLPLAVAGMLLSACGDNPEFSPTLRSQGLYVLSAPGDAMAVLDAQKDRVDALACFINQQQGNSFWIRAQSTTFLQPVAFGAGYQNRAETAISYCAAGSTAQGLDGGYSYIAAMGPSTNSPVASGEIGYESSSFTKAQDRISACGQIFEFLRGGKPLTENAATAKASQQAIDRVCPMR